MGQQARTLDQLQKLKDDFTFYAKNCLIIKTKDKGNTPLELNIAQQYIHKCIEAQRYDFGKVRAIILKGRQQGASTYTEGRFIWRTTFNESVSTFILTHEEDASQNLFNMSKRYYDNLPVFVQPSISASNAKELKFDKLDSGFKVGTAGNKSVGRSQTNQFFHGSEVAFWPNAAEHAKGILQTIPDSDGTEIIYESTANGLGNFFHEQWKLAESGQSEFIPIFVPWFWQPEYRKDVPDDFVLTDEEELLVDHYKLDHNQICWRRNKIVELSAGGTNGETSFKQEYPCNAAEAFQTTGKDGLITAPYIMKARKSEVNPSGPFVIGVDPSRGGDRFSMVSRMGRKAYNLKSWVGTDVDTLGQCVSKCKQALDEWCPIAKKVPDMMFIDAGGGADIVDRLIELGYEDRVTAIAFGSSPLDDTRYKNKRGEMWGECNLWLRDENVLVQIPDSDSLQADLCASPFKRDSNDRIILLPKDEIKKQYGFSPDEGDALVLTFAEPVILGNNEQIDPSAFYANSTWKK